MMDCFHVVGGQSFPFRLYYDPRPDVGTGGKVDMLPKKPWSRFLFAFLAASAILPAQIFQFTREQLIEYTPKNPYERSADGRPKVPRRAAQEIRDMSAKKCGPSSTGPGLQESIRRALAHSPSRKKLIGRAFTAQFHASARRRE